MNDTLTQALKRIEKLITRPAESLTDPEERQTEFLRRLERTRRLMALLGDPQGTQDVIHIGGTSGKGSVAMLCESILRAAGMRVGTHTTPYLQTPLEKVRVDGSLISPGDAIALSEVVMHEAALMAEDEAQWGNLHYAEAWLGLALRHFADQNCQVSVVEVGMGGRYDCTNVVVPRVSVISTVHYDHTLVLGETLEEIAYHKAGIIKAGVPVVVGAMPDVALGVIEQEARQRGSRLVHLGRDLRYDPISLSQRGGRFTYHGLGMDLDDVEVSLLGGHQLANAAMALAALEVYADLHHVALGEQAIREGLARTHFAGRMEVVQREPTVVLDGAHNEEKVGALITALPEVFERERLIMVLGMLETKNAGPIIGALASVADVIVTTAPHVKGKPALPPDEVARLACMQRGCVAEVGGEPLEALGMALEMAGPKDLVVVTGSLYLIGMVRSHWHPVDAVVAQRTMFPNGQPNMG